MASIWALGPLQYREAGSKTRWKLSRPRYRGCPRDVRIKVHDDAEVCLTILGNGRSGQITSKRTVTVHTLKSLEV
jgi:hypothetical protein